MATKDVKKKKTGSGGGFQRTKPASMGDKHPRVDELVDMFNFPKGKFVTLRFLPHDDAIIPAAQFWITIKTASGSEVNIPKWATNFDQENDEFTDKTCPYADAGFRPTKIYYANAIFRDLQEDKPRKVKPMDKNEKATGKKTKDSEAWTPVRVIRLATSLAAKIKGLAELNKVKDKKKGTTETYDVTDAEFGCDIEIKFNPKASGTDKWEIQKGERTPLTEEELAYLYYDLSEIVKPETASEARAELSRMTLVDEDSSDDDEDDDDDDVELGKKKGKKGDKKKPAKKSAKKSKDADDDDDEDEEDEEEEEVKSKSKKKPGKKAKDEDDEEEEDDDDSDDDEDDSDDDDDDDDSDDDDSDDDDDDDDDDSDDDDDDDDDSDDDDEEDDDSDDEDDEEEEKPKGKKKPAKKEVKKSKSKSKSKDDDDDEDDDDDDDIDEDDDEEEEKPKGKKKPAKKEVKKPAKKEVKKPAKKKSKF